MAGVDLAHNLEMKLKQLASAAGVLRAHGSQLTVEDTSLAVIALGRSGGPEYDHALTSLLALRKQNGSWPAFAGDDGDGCWVTALAVLALIAVRRPPKDWLPGIEWLLNAKGREAHWFWRWRFRSIDSRVKFNPAKYGWSWVAETTSWVIPTAFSMMALEQATGHGFGHSPAILRRIALGTAMLLDRMCPGGGWNAGNGLAFGVPYDPYIDATSISLIALRQYASEPAVQCSLWWLEQQLPRCPSPYSLAWGILALVAHRNLSSRADEMLGRVTRSLMGVAEKTTAPGAISTIAVCALALQAVGGDNPFGEAK